MTSFEFKFTKKNVSDDVKQKSKVFSVKKQKPGFDNEKEGDKFKFKEGSGSANIRKSFKESSIRSSNNNINFSISNEPTTLIKRKGKKDKLKKSLINDNTEATDTQKVPKHHSLFSEKYKNIHINPNMRGVSVVEKVFSAGNKFSELKIHKYLQSNLEKHQYRVLTNVQEKSIPLLLSGKNCLIRSQTGSGKTLTYAVPILNSLVNMEPKIKRSDGVQAIVVVPTRELAIQTHELFTKLNSFQWIITGYLCGGENRKTEKDKLRRGVHVLIGTPGRLLDHILHTNAFSAKNVKFLVLDEADRLLDMGFKKDIVRLVEEVDDHQENSSYDPLALLKGKHTGIEAKQEDQPTRQTILLSATLTKGIGELAEFTMKEHIYIDALDESATTNPDHMIMPNTVKQQFILSFVKHRLVTLAAFLIENIKKNTKTFVFMATTQMVEFHYDLFNKYLLRMPVNKGKLQIGDVLLLDEVELDSDDEEQVLDAEFFKLHGNMSQKDRKAVFNGFRKSKKGILLCTDVVARGIDVPETDCIVQYTGPQSDEDYLHRVGRTGRAGKSGSSVIFLTHEEQDYISHLQDHKVFLKQFDTDQILVNLAAFMDVSDKDNATVALQKRFETAISRDKELHNKACFAYSSWSRFYSAFPNKLKSIFDLKKINVGHYVTSFALRESPTAVSRFLRGQASKSEPRRLNKKLANHQDNEELKRPKQKRPIKSLSLTTSEYSSGLEPVKKKRKIVRD